MIYGYFKRQIKNGGPVTITDKEMTRFLLSLNDAVDTVLAAINNAVRGEIYIPKVPSANMLNIAKALIGEKDISINFIGVRPGEKMHEIMVSEEESGFTYKKGKYGRWLADIKVGSKWLCKELLKHHHAVEYTGAKAVLTDVNFPSGNLNLELIKRNVRITTNIKPSIRSKIPPCPGKIFPISLTFSNLLKNEIVKSPICATKENMIARKKNFGSKNWINALDVKLTFSTMNKENKENINDPKTPDKVLISQVLSAFSPVPSIILPVDIDVPPLSF